MGHLGISCTSFFQTFTIRLSIIKTTIALVTWCFLTSLIHSSAEKFGNWTLSLNKRSSRSQQFPRCDMAVRKLKTLPFHQQTRIQQSPECKIRGACGAALLLLVRRWYHCKQKDCYFFRIHVPVVFKDSPLLPCDKRSELSNTSSPSRF